MSQTKVREILIQRFKEDLIGPIGGIDEELFKDPDYNYHSGKLYPSGEDVDEIDTDDIEFPNDLLQELDKMEFHVY